MANRTTCEKRSLNLVLMFALLALAASSCSRPRADADSIADVATLTATAALAEPPPRPSAISAGRETPGTPAGSPPTTTPAPSPTQAPPESISPIPHDDATLASPAPIGTTVTFPGGLELTIVDVIYPATQFLTDNVAGADFQLRLADEAAADRTSLVVEWIAACPNPATTRRATPACGALLSATAAGQPLVDLATYEPRFPQILNLPYGVPARETRRSFIVNTAIPNGETPALLEVVYYQSDAGGVDYFTAIFDLHQTP